MAKKNRLFTDLFLLKLYHNCECWSKTSIKSNFRKLYHNYDSEI